MGIKGSFIYQGEEIEMKNATISKSLDTLSFSWTEKRKKGVLKSVLNVENL